MSFWNIEQPGPHGTSAPEIPNDLGPAPAQFSGTREQPHITAVGFPDEGTEPIGGLFGIRRCQVLTQLPYGAVRPPKKVRASLFASEVTGSGG